MLYEISPTLTAEAGLFGNSQRRRRTRYGPFLNVARSKVRRAALWYGLGARGPASGCAAATSASPALFASGSLAPWAYVGLQSNQLPLGVTGYSDTFAARWDAEWTDRFFTSLDFQHQEFTTSASSFPVGSPPSTLRKGGIDRASATANMRLGGGFGAFATFAYANSENRDPDSFDFGGRSPSCRKPRPASA